MACLAFSCAKYHYNLREGAACVAAGARSLGIWTAEHSCSLSTGHGLGLLDHEDKEPHNYGDAERRNRCGTCSLRLPSEISEMRTQCTVWASWAVESSFKAFWLRVRGQRKSLSLLKHHARSHVLEDSGLKTRMAKGHGPFGAWSGPFLLVSIHSHVLIELDLKLH